MSKKVTEINTQLDEFELFAILNELNILFLAYSELVNIENNGSSSNSLRILNGNFKMLLQSIDIEVRDAYDIQSAFKKINNG